MSSTGIIINSEILVNGLVENSLNYYIDDEGTKYDFTKLKEIYDDIYSTSNYFDYSASGMSGLNINNFSSRIVCGNTYSIHGDVTINVTNSNIGDFQTNFNTFGEIDYVWNKLIKLQKSKKGDISSIELTQNQYLEFFECMILIIIFHQNIAL